VPLGGIWRSYAKHPDAQLSLVGSDDGEGIAIGHAGNLPFLNALRFLPRGRGFWCRSVGSGASDVTRCDPSGAAVRQRKFEPLAALAEIDHCGFRAIRDALEVMRAAGFLVQGNTGLRRGFDLGMVAALGSEGDGAVADRHQECQDDKPSHGKGSVHVPFLDSRWGVAASVSPSTTLLAPQ
jgi:hypothetical protein